MGWSDLLLHGEVDPSKQRRAIETIARNANSQCQLIDDLLEVSRIITGKLRPRVRSLRTPADYRSSGGKYPTDGGS
jgi:signal transduction histidine kinase